MKMIDDFYPYLILISLLNHLYDTKLGRKDEILRKMMSLYLFFF